jgi:hypothetical protein
MLAPGLVAGMAFPPASPGVTFTLEPLLVPAALASLAGTLLLATDLASRVSVSVRDGSNTWQRNFYDYNMAHTLPLLGLKPDRTNTLTVTVYDRYRNAVTAPQPLVFITGPLPAPKWSRSR